MHILEAKIRTATARDTRDLGMIPAVVYGKDVPSTGVMVHTSEFIKLYREVGKNHVFQVSVDGKTYPVLIQELQKHPVYDTVLHIDLLVIDIKKPVLVSIPVKLIGVSPAVTAGGKINQHTKAIQVRVLPENIVDSFTLDINTLQAGKSIKASELGLDATQFELVTPADLTVVVASAPRGGAKATEADAKKK